MIPCNLNLPIICAHRPQYFNYFTIAGETGKKMKRVWEKTIDEGSDDHSIKATDDGTHVFRDLANTNQLLSGQQ